MDETAMEVFFGNLLFRKWKHEHTKKVFALIPYLFRSYSRNSLADDEEKIFNYLQIIANGMGFGELFLKPSC